MRNYKRNLDAAIEAAKTTSMELTVVSYIDDFGHTSCGYGPAKYINGLFGSNATVIGKVSADGKFTKVSQKS